MATPTRSQGSKYSEAEWNAKIKELSQKKEDNTRKIQEKVDATIKDILSTAEKNAKSFSEVCTEKKKCEDTRDKMHQEVMNLKLPEISEIKPPDASIQELICDPTSGRVSPRSPTRSTGSLPSTPVGSAAQPRTETETRLSATGTMAPTKPLPAAPAPSVTATGATVTGMGPAAKPASANTGLVGSTTQRGGSMRDLVMRRYF